MHKLESLGQGINRMLESDNYDKDELIRKSQELDKYIVEVMKQEILKPIAVKDENKKRIRNDY